MKLIIGFLVVLAAATSLTAFQQPQNFWRRKCARSPFHVNKARAIRNQKRPSPSSTTILSLSPTETLRKAFLSLGTQNKGALNEISKVPPPGSAAVVVERFFQAYNNANVNAMLELFLDSCEYDDTAFLSACQGKTELEQRLLLQFDADIVNTGFTSPSNIVLDDMAVSQTNAKIGVKFHYEKADANSNNNDIKTKIDRGSRGMIVLELDPDRNFGIQRVFWVTEPKSPAGENGLRVLGLASKVIEATGYNPVTVDESVNGSGSGSSNMNNSNEQQQRTVDDFSSVDSRKAPIQYFAAWNRRDMGRAVSLFADTVVYDDTAFPKPFKGIDNLKAHLNKCADTFPSTFTFEVDDIIVGGDRIVVCWHVENSGEPLPYTRGCSFYVLDQVGKIQDGIDFVEPSPPKTADLDLVIRTTIAKISQDQFLRIVPLVVWIAYMYIVFFSDGILPGANALQLEKRTWEEVRDLSLNFFLVSPLLQLPFSPTVHPMLEGVFNLLLSWAGLFAGFLSDDRKDKPNVLPMLPIVIGMQFLTSAFLLPFLFTRNTETRNNVTVEELSPGARVYESPLFGLALGAVGTGSIAWFFLGRPEYGELGERWISFLNLLNIDRVGSSFIVDLAIFALFQAWLVDDDLKRRGSLSAADDSTQPELSTLRIIAKFVPFFGLVAYIALRPAFPASSTSAASSSEDS